MSKMPSSIGPELPCLQVSYFLQEVSDTTNLGILCRLFGSLRHARLTTIKSAFGLDIIECLHLFVKINLDLGSQASIPFLYETQLLFSFKISLLLFGFLVIRYKYEITK